MTGPTERGAGPTELGAGPTQRGVGERSVDEVSQLPDSPWCRDAAMRMLTERRARWDLIVIGGGATGVGVAMDAASRGLSVLLVERFDFGKGTSSRSTKLVHGGVRYLRQGNLTLVRDALAERSMLRVNAPHVVDEQRFMIPCYSWWQRFLYGVGLKLYDLLAVRGNFAGSRNVGFDRAIELIPNVQKTRLKGGVLYSDGQFDDARLLINMARTAADHGACLLNYATVTGLLKDDHGRVSGVNIVDGETGNSHQATARCVINAAGPFCDAVRRLDDAECEPMLAASQGVHLVLPRHVFPGDVALIVPKTSDGRVVFIIPWSDRVLIGTTDTPIAEATPEPIATKDEIEFLLETAARYLTVPVQRADVLSVFTGIRPLVRGDASAKTASLSRDHVIRYSESGLLTITGGKWTTVRKMSEDCVDSAVEFAGLKANVCVTGALRIHGAVDVSSGLHHTSSFGADLASIRRIEDESPSLAEPLHPSLPVRGSEVVWVVRAEMARTIDDVLARRTRCLILDARAAVEIAPQVAQLMAAELGRDTAWQEREVAAFGKIAERYMPP